MKIEAFCTIQRKEDRFADAIEPVDFYKHEDNIVIRLNDRDWLIIINKEEFRRIASFLVSA